MSQGASRRKYIAAQFWTRPEPIGRRIPASSCWHSWTHSKPLLVSQSDSGRRSALAIEMRVTAVDVDNLAGGMAGAG